MDLRLGGTDVSFPYVPYGIQKAMLAKIAVTLTNKEHSLIESPTGTGKTLVLLCASLAWQKQSKTNQTPHISARLKKQLLDKRLEKLKNKPCSCGRRPNRTELDELKDSKENLKKGCDGGYVKQEDILTDDELDESAQKRFKPSNDKLESSPYFKSNARKPKEPEYITIDSDSDDEIKEVKKEKETETVHEKEKPEDEKTSTQIDDLCKNCQAIKVEDEYNNEMGVSNIRLKVGKVPRIYYGTRTHKQITQVIRELNKTCYKEDVKMCILSSRDRTCINEEVKDQPNRNDLCQDLVKNKSSSTSMSKSKAKLEDSCPFYKDGNALAVEFERIFDHFKGQAWDIEDAADFGKENYLCPYYGVRAIQDQADITFCPYNYLLDPNIRKSLNINLSNAVIILDEAHNIEDICRDSASLVINTKIIDEILETMKVVSISYVQGSTARDAYDYFRNLFTDMKAFLVRYNFGPLGQTDIGNRDSLPKRILNQTEMLNTLETLGLSPRELGTLKENLGALKGEDESSKESSKSKDASAPALSHKQLQYINQLTNVLDFMYSSNSRFVADYRCVIARVIDRELGRPQFKGGNKVTNSNDDIYALQLSLLCMNPGIAFEKIHSSAWSVIVASGTLSPIESLKTELGCQFNHVFEGSHVINQDRIYATILSRGPKQIDLNCSFSNSLRLDFQDEVGAIVKDVCKSIPNGILCFFPSYERMESFYQRWFAKGFITDIQRSGKKLFREQKNFTASKFEEELEKYHKHAKSKGALLFAVFRGKVSEGIDFADTAARAVITIGIPFPNIKETTIGLKKDYNDAARSLRPHLMPGRDWYSSQAFRALNQALGRCIRHKDDWGAIIMIDSRLRDNNNINNISKWIKRVVSTPNSYSIIPETLKDFVNRRTNPEEN